MKQICIGIFTYVLYIFIIIEVILRNVTQLDSLKNNFKFALTLFESNFSANRTLPSSYLFWTVKRLVDYL
jgi:hypothetical protein